MDNTDFYWDDIYAETHGGLHFEIDGINEFIEGVELFDDEYSSEHQ